MNSWFKDNINDDIAKSIIRLSVNLPGGKVTRDFRPDVHIDYDELEVQLQENPSAFAFWSAVLSEQRAIVSIADRQIKVRRATIANEIFEGVKEVSGSSRDQVPKWRVDEILEADDDLNALEAKLILAKRTESKLFAIVDAIRMKSEHLRSLAGFKRQELRDS